MLRRVVVHGEFERTHAGDVIGRPGDGGGEPGVPAGDQRGEGRIAGNSEPGMSLSDFRLTLDGEPTARAGLSDAPTRSALGAVCPVSAGESGVHSIRAHRNDNSTEMKSSFLAEKMGWQPVQSAGFSRA